MICPDCGRQINDDSVSCPFCGKIFVSQRAKPDRNKSVDEQITSLSHQLKDQVSATDKAVGHRRQQRWFFYGMISLLILGSVAIAVNIYNDYTKLALSYAQLEVKVKSRESDLERINSDLAQTQSLLNENSTDIVKYREDLIKNKKNLTDMTDRNKKLEDELAIAKQNAELYNVKYTKAEAVIYNLITRLGVKLPTAEISQMPIAFVTADLLDTDKDGLTDEFEKVIGTDELKPDSDGDGYSDRSELESGFNPKGHDKLANKINDNLKGRVVYSDINGDIVAWYVGVNSNRYYLGLSGNSFEFMANNIYWRQK